MLSRKIGKLEQQKQHCKTHDFLMVGGLSRGYVGPSILRAMWAHLGAMLAHLGAMLAHLGAMLAYLGAMLAYLGGYVGPSWGLCWPILRLCWSILRPMLAHVDPSRATRSEKWEKHVECHRAKKHCKLQGVLSTRASYQRSAAGAAAPLSYGEERNAYGKDTGRGCWPDLSAYARQPARGPSCGYMLAYVGLMLTHAEPKDPKNGNSKKHIGKRTIF